MTREAAKTPLRASLREGSSLLPHVENGIGAVEGSHREYFDTSIRATFSDSLNLDQALQAGREQENRWDYLIGHAASGQVVAVEPHSARQDEISTVIKKREAAREQLRGHLRDGTKIARWLWVASGKVHFAATEKARLRLDQNGIEFVGKVVMAKHLPAAEPTATSSQAKSRSRETR